MSSKGDDFGGIGRQDYGDPSIDEIATRIQGEIARFGGKKLFLFLLVIVIGIWLASGIQ